MSVTIPCPSCDGRGRYTVSRSPFAALYVCEECHGDCRARCYCGALADDAQIIGRSVTPLCARHMAEWTEDADADATD